MKDSEGIAIVGMACRMPGAPNPSALWQVLSDAVETIGEPPAARRCGTRRGGFIENVDRFDAEFFGIAPKEAATIDPQQRLALELAWESLEDAGMVPDRAGQAPVGVFLGVMSNDYSDLVATAGRGAVTRHMLTGVGRAIIANRISYLLGFSGPSLTVDTGQSSSLAAVHLACESLLRGEAQCALAGGVSLILSPLSTLLAAEFGALSSSGRCYALDARADGHVRGEGGGIVVLKVLSQALHDGDRIYGVIRGSAMNTGSDESGLSVPSQTAQARVCAEALRRADVDPWEVQYVELHGTGTPVGDPIEAAALGEVYGQHRPHDDPLAVGSIKTNIGHLEGAAGVAGLIKVALCIYKRELVTSLNFSTPNPGISLEEQRLRVVCANEPWSEGHRPIAAGVSSFGMGGANCHVILTGARRRENVTDEGELGAEGSALPLLLSAKSEEAVSEQAARLHHHLTAHPDLRMLDVAFSAVAARTQFDQRAAVVGCDRRALMEALKALAHGRPATGVVRGTAHPGGTVFMFPGQGSQHDGMALELLESAGAFAQSMRACVEAFAPYVDWSLEDVLRGTAGAPSLKRVDVVQPALFAVMVSLAALWRAHGVEPAAVVGHSQGEIAAAHVAGGLSLADAARVVTLRSRALADELAGRGGMASVSLDVEEIEVRLRPWGTRLSLAAVNGPASVVVAGEPDALQELLEQCEREGVWARRIPVDYASHSTAVEELRERLLRALAPIRPRSGDVPFFSTALGRSLDTAELDAEYWYRSLREQVRFAEATRALLAGGAGAFVEISPHPVLLPAVRATVDQLDDGERITVIGSLRRGEQGLQRFVASLAEAHAGGVEVDWGAFFAGRSAQRVDLPTYAFQRRRHWLREPAGDERWGAVAAGDSDHPLLDGAVQVAGGNEWLFTARLSSFRQPWLEEHVISATELVPGALFVELLLAVARAVGCEMLDELTVQAPLALLEDGVQLQLLVGEPDSAGRRSVTVYSRAQEAVFDGLAANDRAHWTLHASGLIAPGAGIDADAGGSLAAWPPEGALESIDLERLYEDLSDDGLAYGPAFQGLVAAWRDAREVFAEVILADEQAHEAGGFSMHPVLLGTALQALHLVGAGQDHGGDGVPVLSSLSGLCVHREGAASLRVRLTPADGDPEASSMIAYDDTGAVVLSVRSLCARPLAAAQLAQARRKGREALFAVRWIETPASSVEAPPLRLTVLGELEVTDVELTDLEVERRDDLSALVDTLDHGTSPPELVLVSVPGNPAGDSRSARAEVRRVLELLQAWLAEERLADAQLVVLTQGAVAVREDETPELPAAAVWGLVQGAQAEHPGTFWLVDRDYESSGNDLRLIWPVLLAREDPQIAVRSGRVYTPRLAVATVQPTAPTPAPKHGSAALNREGTVLITGGTGQLGAAVALHLASADDGVPRLLLASRRGLDAPGAQELVDELAGLGCVATIAACDISEREEVAALIDSIPQAYPLTAVIHAAGDPEAGAVASLTEEQLECVMRPKVDGALHLHELTRSHDLAEFVLCSAAAPLFGAVGQAHQAAASAVLDALVRRRRAQGLAGKALAWGPWDLGKGLAGDSGRTRMARLGVATLPAAQALELFGHARAREEASLVPVRLDVEALNARSQVGTLPALLRGLARAPTPGVRKSSLMRQLANLAETEREAAVLEAVRGEVAAVLGHEAQQAIAAQAKFKELGFQSLDAVELRNRLHQLSGVRLPTTLMFDHPTPAAVAKLLCERLENRDVPAAAVARRRVRSEEPIAIVGIGCRFPGGAHSADELWQLVQDETDAVSEFPNDRGWDTQRLYDNDLDRTSASDTQLGGFLYDAGEFDADFFGIGAREALAMDPQQRLLLEGAWEACEHAGIDPESLHGSHTGVFVGISLQDYGSLQGSDIDGLDGFRLTGCLTSVISGRVAYALGLEGPALTVDTACSSSLVALHLASQALRQGECSLALAGGVTVMASPAMFVEFSRQGGLAVDGRCKSFAAGADGTAWSEGMGLLLLERLSDARRHGHHVLASIRGSAVNQDGASNGLTAPNGPSQERVIRAALANAHLAASDIDAVEAHGTGTTLGDPIEAQALIATYGQQRPRGPLRLGSLKSNLGHAQAAAGVGGVIKMVMAMRHGVLPRTLHIKEPSPHVDWSAGEVKLLAEAEAWPRLERPRRAGVSSFGISGTNAHVILEEAPPAIEPDVPTRSALPALPWLLSAKSEEALHAQAERLHAHLIKHPELAAADVAYSLACTRAHLERRAAVVGADRESLLGGLLAISRGESAAGVTRGTAYAGKTAFMFSGQGAQHPEMGAELYRTFPEFAIALDGVCAELDKHLGLSLIELMFAPADSPQARRLDRTEFTQTALFALEVALFRLVETFGLKPDLLIGHSVGELVAAHVAGVMSLADACRLVVARSALMEALPEGGAMIAVEATEEEVHESLADCKAQLSIAALNGPYATVVSGHLDVLGDWARRWRQEERRTTRLRVSHAFHSALMDPMLAELRAVADTIDYAPAQIAIASNLTGELAGEEISTAAHWVRHVRETVRFADGVRTLEANGVTRFLELGPSGALAAMTRDCLSEALAQRAAIVPVLRRERSESEALTSALARVHVDGTPPDWSSFFAKRGARVVDLPTYAFQRQRHWLASGEMTAGGLERTAHPLLGGAVQLAGTDEWLFSGRLSLAAQPWLADHVVLGVTVLPASAFVEIALAAGHEVGCDAVGELVIETPLTLPADHAIQLQLTVAEPDEVGRRAIVIHARDELTGEPHDAQWTRHVSGVLTLAANVIEPITTTLREATWPPKDAEQIEVASLYERLAAAGLDYGPAFRCVSAAWRRAGEVFAEIKLDERQRAEAAHFGVHPALLDAALHGAWAAKRTGLSVPFSWSDVRLERRGVEALRVHVVTDDEHELRLTALDDTGEPFLQIESLIARRIDEQQFKRRARTREDSLYELEWIESPAASPDRRLHMVALGELEGTAVADRYPDLDALGEAIASGAPTPDAVLVAVANSDVKSVEGEEGKEGEEQATGDELAGAVRSGVQWTLALLKRWLADPRLSDAKLVILTANAVAVGAEESPDLAAAPLWGLLRSAQAEHPGRFVLVDCASREELPWAALLAADEAQLAVRGEVVYVPRLALVADERRAAPVSPDGKGKRVARAVVAGERRGQAAALNAEGTILITGGTGGLGALLARHLVDAHGARRLLLLSRRGVATPGAGELSAELAERGCQASIAACDITDRDALAAVLAAIPPEHPLSVVIHTAGVLDDATIELLSDEQLDRVLRPKVDGALHLHELTRGAKLSGFLLFSSVAATLGSPGQANYAAANGFLDGLAQHRRAQGLAGLALAWGLWEEPQGMAGRLDAAGQARWRRAGVRSLPSASALGLLDRACGIDRGQLIPVQLDPGTLRAQARTGTLPGVLRGLVRDSSAWRREGGSVLAQRLAAAPEHERDALILELVCAQVAALLDRDHAHAVDPEMTFKELGFDSLAGVELRNRLDRATAQRLPPTLVFDHPTPTAVAAMLRSRVEDVGRLAPGGEGRGRGVLAPASEGFRQGVLAPASEGLSQGVSAPASEGLGQGAPQLARRQVRSDEPIAILGMSCCYPGGVRNPAQLWELLVAGRDAVSTFPADRGWDLEGLYHPDPDHPHTSYTQAGGFLDDAGEFDADFFGIGPREALAMDPQQRLLLEGAWEAIEYAGIDPVALRGTDTGVFVGVMYGDYGSNGRTPQEAEGYLVTGVQGSVVSGRIAFALGLEGPAMTVDTACSSSLVALHLACQAVRQEECSLALVGGVTVLATPRTFTEFSRQRGLAPDGRCKSFAAAADGVGWSEGAGLLLVERLSDARRNGHRVLAVVRGSAVNQDGASNGLTAPNGPSQERVIRRALANAGLAPADVDAVEAHGTGTPLGDPIEAQALLATYGSERANGPLRVGSIKSNLGHTQAAAGVGGVIKVVLAMRHGLLPQTLNIDAPTPHVDWSAGQIALLREPEAWTADERPRRAGVSAFGISGTNAHVILEQAPPREPAGGTSQIPAGHAPAGPGASVGVLPWLVSAKSEPALRAQAQRLHAHLQARPELDPLDVAYTLATARTQHQQQRAAILGADRDALLAGLDALAHGEQLPGLLRDAPTRGKTAFMFTGQGAQRVGMGRALYESEPVFQQALDRVCLELDPLLGRPVKDVMFAAEGSPEAELLGQTEFTQAALFALEVALFELLRSWRIKADQLIGHSIGELVAAHVAGVMSLADACTLVAARGRLMGALPTGGAMLAIEGSEDEVRASLEELAQGLSIAAVNGPRAVVVAGDSEAVDRLADRWQSQGRKATRLSVSHAFHSQRMEPMLDEFRRVAETLSFAPPRVPIISNLTGEQATEELLSPDYWVRQVRATVRFADGVTALQAAGVRRFLELGPDGVLTAIARDCLSDDIEEQTLLAPILRARGPEAQTPVEFLARAQLAGAAVDWGAFFAGRGASQVELPTYAFQRRRYWLQGETKARESAATLAVASDHPLLDSAMRVAGERDEWLFSGRLTLAEQPWLADHAVFDVVLLPGTAFVELALCAGRELALQAGHEPTHMTLEELTLQAPLVVPADDIVALQLVVEEPNASRQRNIAIYSSTQRTAEGPVRTGAWTLHASGVLVEETHPEQVTHPALVRTPDQTWPPAGAEPLKIDELYERLAAVGFGYGPAFQGLRSAWGRGEEIFAEVRLDDGHADQAGRFAVHPALLDAAFHAVLELLGDGLEAGTLPLPFSLSGVRLHCAGAAALRLHLLAPAGAGVLSLLAFDEDGAELLSIESLRARPVVAGQLYEGTRAIAHNSLLRLQWTKPRLPTPSHSAPRLAVLGGYELAGVEDRFTDLAALTAALDAGMSPPDLMISVASASGAVGELAHVAGRDLARTVREAVIETLSLLRAWLSDERLAETRLALVTRGAVAIADGESPDLTAAPLWGLLRSAQSEHPGRFLVVDVEDDREVPWSALIGAEEPQLAVREGSVYAPCLAPAVANTQTADTPRFDPNGTVLITGGAGGIGGAIALHLVRAHGVRQLLLLSRRGPHHTGADELLAALQEYGCSAQIVACDVTDRDALAAVIASIPSAHPLHAVIHAAGTMADGLIESLSEEQVQHVMRPKVDAALHLHELTRQLDLREFILFSSAAPLLGGAGQGNYAAANGFLDALAQHRRALGLVGTSLAWGLWAQASDMTRDRDAAELERLGRTIRTRLALLPLTTEEGLRLFDATLASTESLLAPVHLDAAALQTQARSGLLPALLRGIVKPPTRAAGETDSTLARRFADTPESGWEALALELVRDHVAAVLGHDSAAAVAPERAFKELGFDSLAAVELRNRLREATGLRLPATLVFDHPSPALVARLVLAEIKGAARAAPPRARRAVRREEPVAIVGMSCRYPGGVGNPQQLWELLAAGKDAVSAFPTDRGWDLERLYDPNPDRSGASYTREGGFLHDAGEFDADFFGVAPREAIAMDPQQRLLLEAAWEAFEEAGIDPHSRRGTDTGVFAGVMYSDYGLSGRAPREAEGYLMFGSAGSVVSGRVAYTFGLEGPAITVDTACSSSLVALHLACQALSHDECSMALAGGVTVLSTPRIFIEFARQRGLAPDGRCKSFAAAADGVGWSEGVGLVLVERLADARRLGHPVLALVTGSATNQDGASNGLAAPNGPSQERVILQGLANAGLSPADVDAVEAHGTGTTLGDPIEAQALLATYGQAREHGPLRLGSIKSNLGHAQAAAGIGGVIKIVKALEHAVLPRTLHLDEPSPHVDWTAGALELLAEPAPWPPGERRRRAAVSGFGISGTNAHVIIEEAPPVPVGGEPLTPDAPSLPAVPLLLSAKSASALVAQAQQLRTHLEVRPELDPLDLSLSLASSRAQLEHRAAVVGGDRAALLAGLDALVHGELAEGVVADCAQEGKTVVMFTGQGAQRPGMGAELASAFPIFSDVLDNVCREFDTPLGRPLRELLLAPVGSPTAALLERTEITQPALFAFEVALFRLIESLGIEPDFLIGHSIGELVAAHVAGMLPLAEACALVAARGRLMGALPAGGGMLALEASEEEVAASLAGLTDRLAIAAVNGPHAVVVAGECDALESLADAWRERERGTTSLRVSHAFHSQRMDAILADFRTIAERLAFAVPAIPIVSNLTGELADERLRTADYWVRQLREPVRFAAGIATLEAAGVTHFLELGPDRVLSTLAQTCLSADAQERVRCIGTLRANRPEPQAFLEGLVAAHAHGVDVDWPALYAGRGARRVGLPTYAFQRRRYWLDQPAGGEAMAGVSATEHPLLERTLPLAGDQGFAFTGRLALSTHQWLTDHVIFDIVLLPGAAFVELALAAAARVACEVLEELTLEAPLVLEESSAIELQLLVGAPEESGRRPLTIYARPEPAAGAPAGEIEWRRHASGVLAPAASIGEPLGGHAPATGIDEPLGMLAPLQTWPPADAEPLTVEDLYSSLAARGLGYGPAFQGVAAAWRCGEELFVEVNLDEHQAAAGESFSIHPALLDAAFHAHMLNERWMPAARELALPFSLNGVRLHRDAGTALRARLTPVGERALRLTAFDEYGAPVLSIEALHTRPVTVDQLLAGVEEQDDPLFRVVWAELPSPPTLHHSSHRVALLGAVELVGVEGERYGDLDALVQALAAGAPIPDVVLVSAAPDGREDSASEQDAITTAELAETARANVGQTLELLQAWLADERLAAAQLVFLTRRAIAAHDDEAPDLAVAPLWGLVRSAQSEHPGRFLLIDVDREDSVAWQTLLGLHEPQLALRAGKLYAPRLTRLTSEQTLLAPAGEPNWHLGSERHGTLEDLALLANPRADAPLGPGEVRIAIHAAGLNFRDVLIALGHYPGSAPIGSEGAGVVLEIGPGVSDLASGERVMGLITDAFGPVGVSDRRLLAPIPKGWSFLQAAAVPLIFLTAYYALVDLAELRSGEALLVHAGAGGVGSAAVQLAHHLGAEVFATASPKKVHALLELGVPAQRIASSRTLDFKRELLAASGGRGVDVVLNALAGEFVDASLELLPRGGRFIEMGKTDIRDAELLAAKHRDVRYRAFDLLEAGPERIQAMLCELLDLFERGALRHPTVASRDVRRGAEAFRCLREGRHIGKLVLTIPQRLDPDATVLITGGTGGIGALLARHLAAVHGARRLLLVNRRGPAAPGASELVAELAQLDCAAEVRACDVTDRAHVAELISAIAPEHPLTAVIHTAGVLDDATIESLSAEQVDRVMRAKVDATLNLHELTKDLGLAEFVMCSSDSGIIGAPGQGNYAAANVFLDAFAHWRRAHGLPGQSLAWGLWSNASGMAGSLDAAGLARLERLGVGTLSDELRLFDRAREAPDALVVPTRLNMQALHARAHAETLPPLFAELVRAPTSRRRREQPQSLDRRLAGMSAAERDAAVLELVCAQAAVVLGHELAQDIDARRAFKELGLDSLGAVELRNRLAQTTGLRLPSTLIFDHPSPAAVAGFLASRAAPRADASNGAGGAPTPTPTLDGETAALKDLDAAALIQMTFENREPVSEPGRDRP